MNNKLREIEVLLDKMNKVFRSIQMNAGKANKIELDMLKEYTRQFYENLLEHESGKNIVVNIEQHEEPIASKDEKITEQNPDHKQEEKKQEQEIKHEQIEDKKTTNQENNISPEIKPLEQKIETGMKKKPLLISDDEDEEQESTVGLNSKLLNDKKTLADKIKVKTTSDLLKSIDLIDKFYFIRELFKGNHQEYELALKSLNVLSDYESSKTFVLSQIADKYQLDAQQDSIERLLKILKERFE